MGKEDQVEYFQTIDLQGFCIVCDVIMRRAVSYLLFGFVYAIVSMVMW